ncbi:hypothetical protein PN498_00155 [Oscillatoria sp. CS-180]|nr:hypothetical protein [Oscillatoria sp. CS-180]
MLSPEELQAGLAHFTGTQRWYRYRCGEVTLAYYTDGIQYLAKNAECYWLLTEIVSVQTQTEICQEPFQVWHLKLNEHQGATLQCEDGNDNIVFTKDIPFTDFPLPEITIWVEFSEMEGVIKPVLLLPSEH